MCAWVHWGFVVVLLFVLVVLILGLIRGAGFDFVLIPVLASQVLGFAGISHHPWLMSSMKLAV